VELWLALVILATYQALLGIWISTRHVQWRRHWILFGINTSHVYQPLLAATLAVNFKELRLLFDI
jgi:hypothetical protein